MDTPVIQKKKGISPIWILPLIALIIGGWLLYTSFRDAGLQITIHYSDAKGITPKKTQVMYKGVAVGLVEQITVDDDLQGVTLIVNMKVKRGLVEDTKFWVVKPVISAGQISGLETVLTGSYIAVQPGTSSVQARHFEGLKEPPVLPSDSPGLHITLRANALHSMQKGSPVYTRNLQIGKVKDYRLAEDNSILVDIFIKPEFAHLIQVGTRFWNASGISLEGNLQSGFNLKMESLASLIYGGISCATPDSLVDESPQAVDGMVFKLYDNFDAAEYGLSMSLQLASGEGIIEGKTRIMYRGLEAGVVKKIRINNDPRHTVTAEILLDPRAESILKEGTRFWVIRPEISIDGIRHLETIIGGPYISFQPGDGEYRDHFVVQRGPMPSPSMRAGKHFTLVSPDSGSLEAGAPVLYKKMVVGEISAITFGPQAETIRTDILIYDEYTSFVRQDSLFWNVSGVEIDASLSHFNVNLSTIKSVLAGGIAFTNPQQGAAVESEPAREGTSFTLYESYPKAVTDNPGLKPPGTVLKLLSSSDNAFDTGAPVLFKNISIGEVLGYELSQDLQNIVFQVLIYAKYTGLLNSTSRFYNFSGFSIDAGLAGIEVQAGPIASIVTGGISFYTPGKGTPVENNDSFVLYENRDAAVNRDRLQVTIHLDRAGGIGEKTKIRYQGIQIGQVRKVRFAPDMKGVIAEAGINREAAGLFRDSTRLLLVKPEIDLSGVRNLETVLTGSYIDVAPGEGEARTEFTLLPEISGPQSFAGLNIILETPRLGSLNRGSPVYYRQMQVGQVTGFELSPSAQQVWVRVNILPAYTELVHTGTKFWLASGVRVSWGLFSGFDLDTESMKAIIAGGIALATPENEKMGKRAEDGAHFVLYEESEKTWLDWSPDIVLNEETGKTAEVADSNDTL
jgi:paraquat-inducible protein B